MITKVRSAEFNWNRNYPYFPSATDSKRKMTPQQRKVLTEFFYTKITDPESVEERLQEMEGFNYDDAQTAIEEFTKSMWQ